MADIQNEYNMLVKELAALHREAHEAQARAARANSLLEAERLQHQAELDALRQEKEKTESSLQAEIERLSIDLKEERGSLWAARDSLATLRAENDELKGALLCLRRASDQGSDLMHRLERAVTALAAPAPATATTPSTPLRRAPDDGTNRSSRSTPAVTAARELRRPPNAAAAAASVRSTPARPSWDHRTSAAAALTPQQPVQQPRGGSAGGSVKAPGPGARGSPREVVRKALELRGAASKVHVVPTGVARALWTHTMYPSSIDADVEY